MFSVVGFCGSRALPPGVSASVVASVVASGRGVAVGCCVGGDRLVLSAVPSAVAAAGRLSVFAAFGPGGAGACSASAVGPVLAAAAAGGSVRWWAGGGPGVPLRGRLASRSVALVRAVAASGPGASFVGLVASPCPAGLRPSAVWSSCGSGSWSSLALAAGLGVPVVVFPLGWSWSSPWPGCWSPGPWPGSWRWRPAARQLGVF